MKLQITVLLGTLGLILFAPGCERKQMDNAPIERTDTGGQPQVQPEQGQQPGTAASPLPTQEPGSMYGPGDQSTDTSNR